MKFSESLIFFLQVAPLCNNKITVIFMFQELKISLSLSMAMGGLICNFQLHIEKVVKKINVDVR